MTDDVEVVTFVHDGRVFFAPASVLAVPAAALACAFAEMAHGSPDVAFVWAHGSAIVALLPIDDAIVEVARG